MVNSPDTQPRGSFRSFLRAFQQGCRRHGCCWHEEREVDLKIELCPFCGNQMVCSPEEEWHLCHGHDE